MSNKIDAPPLRAHYRNKQYNIHPALFGPTNAYFYDGEIESMDDTSKFELPVGWDDMLRTLPGPDSTMSSPDGLERRSRWFEIAGDNVQMSGVAGPGGLYSSGNWQHHLFVVGTLLPGLRKPYGKEVFWKVTLVVPYERQRRLYKDEFDHLMKHGLEQCELPDVWTVTAADHHENISMTDVVILDLVKSRGGHQLGFLKDDDRAAAMFTRARKASLIISGDLRNDDNNCEDSFERRKTWLIKEAGRQGKRPNGSRLASSNAVNHYKRYYAYFGLVVPFKPAGKTNLEELPWYLQPVVITPKMQEWIDLAADPALALRERNELEQRRKDSERAEKELQVTARKERQEKERKEKHMEEDKRTERKAKEQKRQEAMSLVALVGGPNAVCEMVAEVRSNTTAVWSLTWYLIMQAHCIRQLSLADRILPGGMVGRIVLGAKQMC
ncbi:hypothetical protein LTR42_010717 [Elasticomyces elasticus]|nr:hypothetical protein LTR42_010717 [Elasticomyces elasticus]